MVGRSTKLHRLYTFLTAFLIDSTDLFFVFLLTQAWPPKHSHFQFSDWRLNYKPLQTHLFFPLSSWPCSIFLCLRLVRPLLAFISPNSSTTASYLSLFLSPSLPDVTPLLYQPHLLLNQGPSLAPVIFTGSLYPECNVSSLEPLK